MKKMKLICPLLLIFFLIQVVSADIQSPEQFLGFKVGTARKLADTHQIVEYFKLLGKASDRIAVKEVGKTTENNPFIVAVITSAQNHNKLETYRNYQQLLADPRKIGDEQAEKIISDGKAVVMINCTIHSTEIGASQMSMRLAYDLATKNDRTTREILDNVILLLVPMHNPDGIQMVVDWYRKNLGTKYEGSRMPWLYQKYVGHDNNRDWYMFTQIESQLTLKIHNAWHPQIIVDMHQTSSRAARIFVPPFIDPFEPNVDPILRQQVAMMGTFIASELTAEGKAGVIHSNRYDAWTPGRAYHHYHGGIRILTEVESARIATPITIEFEELANVAKRPSVKMPLPWKGGKWTLKDIVEYDYSAAKAVLTNAARLRENWLRNFYRIHKKAVTRTAPPYAFVIPQEQKDLSTAVKMMNILQTGDVEIHKADSSFTAGGKQYPAGTYIIYMAQPYGCFAKALLENQVYPEIREYPDAPLKKPYDVVAHTLPLLMGVETVQVDEPFKANAVKQTKIDRPKGKVDVVGNAFGYVWGHTSNDDIVALNRLMKKNYKVFWAAKAFKANQKAYPAGTMIVKQSEKLTDDLKAIAKELLVHFEALNSRPGVEVYELKPLRLGLYKSWTASIDEGWTRWVLEQYEFPFKSIFDEDIRKGNLNKDLDVIIFPSIGERAIVKGVSEVNIPPKYAGGIGREGTANIKRFIEKGGTLITLDSAAEFAIRHLNLAVQDSSRKLTRKEFFVPGSILKVLTDKNHPITYGYEKETVIFFRNSPVFQAKSGRRVVNYPDSNPLLSGWVNGEKYLSNKSALVDAAFGKGKIILIGFPAQYRAQSHSTFRFLFNSIYYAAAELKKL